MVASFPRKKEKNMELIAADKDTVTIKMNWQDEFAHIFAIFLAVIQEYKNIDREIHNMSKEEVMKIILSLEFISDQCPY